MTPETARELAVVPLPARQIQASLANLRRHTAALHVAVERRVDIVGRLDSSGDYASLLARLFGFYEPFESEMARAVTCWELPFDLEGRQKTRLLTGDLAALGLGPAVVNGLPLLARVPRPTNPLAALGCLYVAEGATLGGRLIARQVARRLGLGASSGASFFHGYGEDVGPRWRTFCSVLAAASCSEVAERAILAGAMDTFAAYDQWLAHDDACTGEELIAWLAPESATRWNG